MPIVKDELNSDVDPSCVSLDGNFVKHICCSRCGETRGTLIRARGKDGKKIKPAIYYCTECNNLESVR